MLRALPTGDFHPESLFQPRSVALLGAATALGQAVLRNLQSAGFKGTIYCSDDARVPAGLTPDLGVVATTPEHLQPALDALAGCGTRTAIAAAPAMPGLPPATKCRLLGPASFGVIVPAIGLNASAAHLQPRPGKLALVSPSAALCRAVIDWAEPNGVGFSHVVGIGAEHDIGYPLILDWLSRDPGTGAILLDIRHIRDRRAFLSAARAAARLRPVVAIHAGSRQHDPTGRNDAVFDAALRRTGILRVRGLAELLAAAETLTRARPPRSESLMIVSNAVGPGQMAADQAVRLGIPLAALDAAAQAILRLHLPPQPPDPGLVWTGANEPTRLAEAVAMLSALPEIGGVVAILAPTGTADAAGVAALAAGASGLKMPLLACVLGETTAAGHRRTLADAGVPVFASPEQAVRGFAQLVELRRARAAARELPTSRVLALAPDQETVRQVFQGARAAGRAGLFQDEALAVLAAYGLPVVPGRAVAGPAEAAAAAGLLGFPAVVKQRQPDPDGIAALALDLPDAGAVQRAAERLPAPHGLLVQGQAGRARRLRIAVADDPLFGPAIGFGPGGRDRLDDAVMELPPLNLALAAGLVARSRAVRLLAAGHGHAAASREAVADALVRVSQLVVDFPEIAALQADPLFADANGVTAADAWIGLRQTGAGAALAIPAYPVELVERWALRGDAIEVRPIRPEDAEAHIALFRRLSPQDIRYRFFSMLRDLAPEQIARLTQVDYDREMAFVAVLGAQTVGVARLVREPPGTEAEFAIVVDAAMKGRGLGRHLMQRLFDWAASQGITAINGQVLADNAPMLAFVKRLGFTIRRLPQEPDVVEAQLTL